MKKRGKRVNSNSRKKDSSKSKKNNVNTMSKIDQTAWVVDRRTVSKSAVKGKRVIIRCDYNVPIKNGVISDDMRIRASLETLNFCLKNGAKQLVLISHLGRPTQKNKEDSLVPIAKRLSELLSKRVVIAPSCMYSDFVSLKKDDVNALIIILENVRFHSEEEKNDVAFARQLSQFGDVYVNDAFGTAHRGHASNSAITKFLPSYVGLLMRNELAKLSMVTYKVKRPLVVMLGFAKISDKLDALTHLLKNADTVLLGGAVAFTFLAAQGFEIGKSKVELDKIPLAKKLLSKYSKKIVLPLDVVCATGIDSPSHLIFGIEHIPPDLAGYDIGPKTVELFGSYIENAKTVFWNGPVGVFERPPFDKGTNDLALWLAQVTAEKGVLSIVGGGDTASAAVHAKVADKLTHISTGGGASLEFMEGKPLSAISAIYKSETSKKTK